MNTYKLGSKPNFAHRPVTPSDDAIRPAHYHAGKIDVIQFAEENFSSDERKGFYRMNALKYITRYDKKNGIEDLQKAQFYLRKLIELEETKCCKS